MSFYFRRINYRFVEMSPCRMYILFELAFTCMPNNSQVYFTSGIRSVGISGNDEFKGVGKGREALKVDDSGIHIKASKTEGNVTDTFKKRNIHIKFSEIENIDSRKFIKAKLVFHTDANTYTVTGLSAPKKSDDSTFDGFSELVNLLKERAAEQVESEDSGDMEKLRELTEMREKGLITDDEFEEMKSDLLG